MMTTIKTIFSIDLRALAFFRIGLGLCLLADLASRARDLEAHYTDAGVLPRAALLGLGHQTFSLYMIAGSTWVQALLFVIAGIVSLALLVGCWTRLATFLSWILFASLIARNTVAVQGGDNLLLLLLFWGLFLPLGARYSVDAALNQSPSPPTSYWSMATTGLLIQVMALYFFSALLKSGPEWVPQGTAIAYALHLDFFVTPLGIWMRNFPSVTYLLTLYVWYLELLAPMLIFSPFWFVPIRWAMVIALATLHLAIAAFLNVGLFPLINIVSLAVFVPTGAWEWLDRRFNGTQARGVTIYYDGDCEFCRKTCLILRTFLRLSDVRMVPAQTVPAVQKIMEDQDTWVVEDADGHKYLRWEALTFLMKQSPFGWIGHVMGLHPFRFVGNLSYRWVAANRMRLGKITALLCPYHSSSFIPGTSLNVVTGLLLAYVLIINIQGLPMVGAYWSERFGSVRSVLGLNQRWDMFAPAPPKIDVWFVVRGEKGNGAVVDVLKGTEGEPDIGKPLEAMNYYPTYRWRKYLSRLAEPNFRQYRPAFSDYLCRTWNRSHGEAAQLASLKLYARTEVNRLDGTIPLQETFLLLVHPCTPSAAS